MADITPSEFSSRGFPQSGLRSSIRSIEGASRRVPWIALALSLFSAGVGHVYCGRIAKALPLYFAWLFVPACWVIATLIKPSMIGLALLILPVLLVLAVYIYAAIDAWKTARQICTNYSLRDFNRTWIYMLLVGVQMSFSVGLVAVAGTSVYEAFHVPVQSMSPTIVAGDRIVANKMLPEDHVPVHGDLIVYRNPTDKGASKFVGRVVAVAGDKIAMKEDRLFINGDELTRDRISAESLESIGISVDGDAWHEENSGSRYMITLGDSASEDFETTVPERHVFVMGDNRSRSRDSRHFGAIHVGDVVGSVDYIHWPAGSWSRFGVLSDK